MENKLHFILKEDGELYVMQEVEVPDFASKDYKMGSYLDALQRAKDNAIKVENKDEVILKILGRYPFDGLNTYLYKKGAIYSLEGYINGLTYKSSTGLGMRVEKSATIIFTKAAQPEETQENKIETLEMIIVKMSQFVPTEELDLFRATLSTKEIIILDSL